MNFCLWSGGSSVNRKGIQWLFIMNYLLISSFTVLISNVEAIRAKMVEPAGVDHIPSDFPTVYAEAPGHEPKSYIRRSILGLPSLSSKYSGYDVYSGNPSAVDNSPGSFNDSSKPPTPAQSPSFHIPGIHAFTDKFN